VIFMKEIKVGMAKADITPEVGCTLYGYADMRDAERVLDPLEVKALAISQNSQTVIIMSAEICAINTDMCEEIFTNISAATGVPKHNMLFACTHTHSGPITRTSAGWGETDMDYMNGTLIPRSIQAAKEAIASMVSATVGIGAAECYAGINRREITPEGEVVLGQNPDGPYDPTMTVVTFKTLNGDNIGSLVHFATHPTVSGRNTSITRDWPGIMVDRIASVTGAPCMYINGAEGNIGPRLSNGRTAANESYLDEIGTMAADAAEKAYRSVTEFTVPDLGVEAQEIEYIYAPLPSLAKVEETLEALGDPAKLQYTDITLHAQMTKIKEVLASGDEAPRGRKTMQTVISLGNLAMVPFPFEAFSDIAIALKQKSPFENTILLGLAMGSFGYLPTKEQLAYGGYEVANFRACHVPPFDENLADHLIEENTRLLSELYESLSH